MTRRRHADFRHRIIGRAAGLVLASVLVSLPGYSSAQTRSTTNTLALEEGATPGRATLDDAVWLVGRWQGSAMGADAEELWLPAAGGALLGVFRMTRPESAQFYEIFTLRPVNGSLVLQLKHFNADMTGWEARDETVDFPLIKAEPDALYFDGLTYRRISGNELQSFVAVHQNDGTVEEISFNFRRVR